MKVRERILSKISAEKVVELTQQLIRIPSWVGQEGDIAQFIYARMLKIGLEVEPLAAEKDRPNLLCRHRGSEGGNPFLLVGHMDTIELTDLQKKEWPLDPYGGILKDNKIYGLGASDMKGAIAAMITAMESVIQSDVHLLNDVIMIFCVDEENGSQKGMQYLIDQKMIESNIAMAVQGEPTNLKVQGWFKGWAEYEITTMGKTTHSSKLNEGINAIHKMIDILHSLKTSRLQSQNHPLLGESTLSIGTIQGGISAKIVPDFCKSMIEIRMVPGQSAEAVLKEIEDLIGKQVTAPQPPVEIRLVRGKDPAEIPIDSPVVDLIREAAKEITGHLPELGKEPIGGGDVNLLIRHLRIPSVLFGPGLLNYSHTPGEFVPVRNVVDTAKIYASLMLKICGNYNESKAIDTG